MAGLIPTQGGFRGMAGLTPAQESCVTSLDKNLIISAGAGTGKTFTITQKIAWMIENGAINSIDEVLAITFTQKAASEMKGRARQVLRSKGMHKQALLVDDAWISTIHGMCSRILKENAIVFGIDPSFEILDEVTANELLEECIEETLSNEDSQELQKAIESIFSEYAVGDIDNADRRTNVVSILKSIIDTSAQCLDGIDGFDLGPTPLSLTAITKMLKQAFSLSLDELEYSQCTLTTVTSAREAIGDIISSLDQLLEKNDAVSFDELARILDEADAIKPLPARSKDKYPLEYAVLLSSRALMDWACASLTVWKGRQALDDFMVVGKFLANLFDSKKRLRSFMTQDDLLMQTFKCLMAHPSVAQKYRDKFKLVMVDEFQDTSGIQILLLRALTSDKAQLCTIGDVQQSIYRFRGADVNVYEKFIEESAVEPVQLDLNFRSHKDILEFSNRIFETPGVFDDRFLYLHAGRNDDGMDLNGMPRINFIRTKFKRGKRATERARKLEAACIAQTFAEYRQRGVDPADMVLLLGVMSHMDIYVDALIAEGFDVVVAGGSGFWATEECQTVRAILAILANQYDSEAIYQLIASGIVPMDDEDLAWLICDEKKRTLSQGFFAIDESSPKTLQILKALIDDAIKVCSKSGNSISETIEKIFVDSGFFAYLETKGAPGSAIAANYLKALRKINEMQESGSLGIVEVFDRFSREMTSGSKEGPGVLMTGAGHAVRVMTIHASKGLEFPIVALADFINRPRPSSILVKLNGLSASVSLKPYRSLEEYSNIKKYSSRFAKNLKDYSDIDLFDGIISDNDCATHAYLMQAAEAREEFEESRRRLYVGITRASEALVLALTYMSSENILDKTSLVSDLHQAFFDTNTDFPDEDMHLYFGVENPALYRSIDLDKLDEEMHNSLSSSDISEADRRQAEVSGSQDNLTSQDATEKRSAIAEPSVTEEPQTPQILFHYDGRPKMAYGALNIFDNSNMFSYSSLATKAKYLKKMPHYYLSKSSKDISEDNEANPADLLSDEDNATKLGSAFHTIAEYMVKTHLISYGNNVMPKEEHIDRIASMFNISQSQRVRLFRALDNWHNSKCAKRAVSFKNILSEVPFCLEFENDKASLYGSSYINGEIDLLCTDDDNKDEAYIVDYKTGGSVDETPEYLDEKHRLQAMCYAWAVLSSQGYKRVDIDFIRVEMINKNDEVQVVSYTFLLEDLKEIHDAILSIHNAESGQLSI